MSLQIIETARAPQAIGSYSQAIRTGDTVYVSGQLAIDPATGQMVSGDIEAEIRRVFDNLQEIAKAAGGSLANVTKLSVFLTDLTHFGKVNEIMTQYFSKPFPGRDRVRPGVRLIQFRSTPLRRPPRTEAGTELRAL